MAIGVELDSKVKSPLDWSKLSAAGLEIPAVRDTVENAIAAQEDYAKALEARYANPNWGKVSAALLKPQLGGFAASMGSAFGELGEQTEQQRAVAPTISRIRAEVASGQIPFVRGMEQQKQFKDYMDKFRKTGQHDFNLLGQIKNLEPESSAAKAIDSILSSQSSVAGTTGTNVGTLIRGQEAISQNPAIVLNDPIFKGTIAETTPERSKQSLANLDAAMPKDVDPRTWAGMSISQKLDSVASYANKNTTAGMDEEQKSAFTARNSDNLLNDLTYLRALAVDPKLAPMFSLFKNGDAISMFRSFLDQNQGNVSAAVEGMVAAAGDQLKNADPETRQKADKFIKGIAKLEVNLRGANVNPTDALQTLNSMQSPSLANSQAGFVGILDQMGLQAKHDIDRHSLRVDSNIPARKILSSHESRDLENRYRDEVEKLAKSNALKNVPSWYRPTANVAPVAPASAPPAANPASAPAGGSMLDRLRAARNAAQ